MMGVPPHDPAQTEFTLDCTFLDGELQEETIVLDDGSIIELGINATDTARIVVFSEDLSVEQVLWTGVYIANCLGVPGDGAQTIRAMNTKHQLETYRLGGLYDMEDLS